MLRAEAPFSFSLCPLYNEALVVSASAWNLTPLFHAQGYKPAPREDQASAFPEENFSSYQLIYVSFFLFHICITLFFNKTHIYWRKSKNQNCEKWEIKKWRDKNLDRSDEVYWIKNGVWKKSIGNWSDERKREKRLGFYFCWYSKMERCVGRGIECAARSNGHRQLFFEWCLNAGWRPTKR